MTISMTCGEFANKLSTILSEVYGPLTAEQGELESRFETARARGWMAKDRSILSTCYQIAGRHKALTHGYVCLVEFSNLQYPQYRSDRDGTDVDGLVFAGEQYTEWFNLISNVDLQSVDPPVWRGWATRTSENHESDHLSCYLLEVVCWNSTGLLPSAQTQVTKPDFDKIATVLNRVTQEKDRYTFQKGPLIAFAEPATDDYRLSVASRSRDEILKFEKEMGFTFEYKFAQELNPPEYIRIG